MVTLEDLFVKQSLSEAISSFGINAKGRVKYHHLTLISVLHYFSYLRTTDRRKLSLCHSQP